MMRIAGLLLIWFFTAVLSSAGEGPGKAELQARRQSAAQSLRDGVLLVHAAAELSMTADGFRQDPFFYYFTGLENTPGAIFALDGRSGESWLFLPDKVPFTEGMQPEASPSGDTSQATGISHIVDWSELQVFFAARASTPTVLYFTADPLAVGDLPANFSSGGKGRIPLWVATAVAKWPSLRATDATERIHYLMAVESGHELAASRAAAMATKQAFMAGLRAIKPGVSQRAIEVAVENACWKAGVHGVSFWPWAMAGENSVFPRPFWSISRYDHLDSKLKSGDLLRLDVGCESNHYGGDLGRTVPVSGKFTEEQREIWNMLVDAYDAASKTFREGTTQEQVWTAWRDELLRHRGVVKTALARQAIDLWSVPKNVPYWQLHTMNLDAAFIEGPLRAGMVIDFEPIVSIGAQGFYLEDMFLVTKNGAEDLTPGVPSTADDIEAAMHR